MKVYSEHSNTLGWKEIIVNNNDILYSASMYKGKLVSLVKFGSTNSKIDPDSELCHMIMGCISEHLNREIGA
jgi:hypothetical protein